MVPRVRGCPRPGRGGALSERLDGRHALVTGASGFVGANLVRALLARGCRVTGLVRESSDPWRLRGVQEQVRLCAADLADAAQLSMLPEEATADLVFHAGAAGVRPGEPAAAVIDANLRGTLNLLDLASRRGGCRRLVFLSSCSVYGPGAGLAEDAPLRGTGVYAETKIAGEGICRSWAAAGMPVVVLRLYTPYGPFEAPYRFVAGTVLRAREGGEIPLTGGEQSRDFIYIGDAVDAIVAAGVAAGVEGETLNVGTGVSTTIREGVETILAATGSRAEPRFGALPYRPDETWEMSGSPARMRARLGLGAPLSFRDGVLKTWSWMSENMDLYQRRGA